MRLNDDFSQGESAGAISVALHMVTNGGNTEGLFHSAFMVGRHSFINTRPSETRAHSDYSNRVALFLLAILPMARNIMIRSSLMWGVPLLRTP